MHEEDSVRNERNSKDSSKRERGCKSFLPRTTELAWPGVGGLGHLETLQGKIQLLSVSSQKPNPIGQTSHRESLSSPAL